MPSFSRLAKAAALFSPVVVAHWTAPALARRFRIWPIAGEVASGTPIEADRKNEEIFEGVFCAYLDELLTRCWSATSEGAWIVAKAHPTTVVIGRAFYATGECLRFQRRAKDLRPLRPERPSPGAG